MRKSSKVLMLLSVAALFAPLSFAQDASVSRAAPEDAQGFKDFSANVQRYVKLHERAEKSLPRMKSGSSPDLIAADQHVLTRRIEQLRGNAHAGEIFTPAATRAFRDAIKREFQSPEAKNARATIQQGEPVKDVRVQVNAPYPAGLPYTSVPPTLLQKFPKLPNDVAYRIVDHDLVLLDVKADFVVDVMTRALP